MSTFNLNGYQLTAPKVYRNLPASALYKHAIRHETEAGIAESGALVAYSGAMTGRSPRPLRRDRSPDVPGSHRH
jgi:phosphoenolpyruvate carboxykinase (ATP)